MHRRALLGGFALLMLPAAAGAQMGGGPPPAGYQGGGMPPSGYPGGGRERGDAAPRRRPSDMSWDELSPRRRRKIQQRLAADGGQSLPPEEARRMWDGMNPRQRRQATRRADGERRQARAGGGRMDDGSMGEARMRRRDADRQMPPPSGMGAPGYGPPPTQ